MSKSGRNCGWKWWLRFLAVNGTLMLPATFAIGQEQTGPAASTSDAADESAPQVSSPSDEASTPTEAANTDAAKSADPTTEQAPSKAVDASAADAKVDAAAAKGELDADAMRVDKAPTPDAPPTTAPTGTLSNAVINGLMLAALIVLPILAGNFLAKLWRMPDYAWKFSLILFTLAVSLAIVTFGEFKFGPDLAGGITLVYELQDASSVAGADAKTGKSPGDPSGDQERQGASSFKMSELIDALKRRVDPTGTREVTIREFGPAVEIIIPQQGQDELDYVKRRLTDVGQLEFRITADPNIPDDRPIILQAKAAPTAQKDILIGGNKVAEWVPYEAAEFGPIDQVDERVVKRMAGDVPEALLLIDPLNVTGQYLTSATKGVDQRGNPAVNFSFDSRGAAAFRRLTSLNKPNPATGAVRYLGIILDKRLISAPSIRETISNHGQISGGAMNEKEVEYTIGILNAGRLPAALNKTPVSEEVISPTLGAVTVEKGKQAILAAMAAVVLFMLVYYRFAGVVACLALTFNLLLVLALMILIKGAFTLPGLAGLVLTIGMAVDANVLIYERIREELRSGAALRMAIRNGYSRAMSAIIDSNVTTIISGIALYAIGTDQVKGFAVTLILGILTSMFTAIFFSRLVLDVCERRGWITKLSMMKILAQPNFNFLGVRWPAIAASLAIIAIGAAAVASRGSQLLDIDFTGGSSVTFTLKESAKTTQAAVHDALMRTELQDKNLLVVERGESGTRFSLDTSEQSVENVRNIVKQTFGDKLMTYTVSFENVVPFTEGDSSGAEATVVVNEDAEDDEGIGYEALREQIQRALTTKGHGHVQPVLSAPGYRTGSSVRFKEWTVQLVGLDADAARGVLEQLQNDMQATPLFPLANKIGGRVSTDMQGKAISAIVVSLIGVIAYLWLRFQKVSYGLAAAIAVAHDVLVTIAMMAISAYIVSWMPAVARALQIDAFQINLTIVAALLTIIGYSLNDTIVTFDRLREIKGKSPRLTAEMVNMSVNQCLSRTILTALTVFLTVVILYFFGGDGIHAFAFAFLVGVIAGTYSTVYIAAPALLWLSGETINTSSSAGPSAGERAA